MSLMLTGSNERRSRGRYPSISMNDERKVIEVRQCPGSRNLYYQVGTFSPLDCTKLEWTEEKDVDRGERGSVAINNQNEVVVVYEHARLRNLLYKVGTLEGNIVTWGDVESLDSGRNPAVAINDAHIVVVAYQAMLYGIHYRIGRIDARQKNITWNPDGAVQSPRPKLFSWNAEHVTIAMNREGYFVAAASSGNIIVCVGRVNFGMPGGIEGQIHDQTGIRTSGITPAVSINNDNRVILVQRSNVTRQLSYKEGRLTHENEGTKIKWACDKQNYGLGCNPSIALSNNGDFLEEHETNFPYFGVGYKLYYRTGRIQPREQGHRVHQDEIHGEHALREEEVEGGEGIQNREEQ